MLIAKGIHKSYQSLHVLKGVDLEVAKSEVIAIVGASGAGKSTLLHILGTLDQPDAGEVVMNGTRFSSLTSKAMASFRNKNLGFVFQFHNLLPEFSALENVMIPGLIAGEDTNTLKPRAEGLLKTLGVGERGLHKPAELSGGEQQRVAVARALINNPLMVFADEPSGNLDSANAQELHRLFFKLRDDFGQTFIIVTHNMDFANMADRKLEMKDGRILT